MSIYVENEIFLSTEYIKHHALLPNGGICLAGGGALLPYLKKTCDALDVDTDSKDFSQLWFASDAKKVDVDAIRALKNRNESCRRVVAIILLENIPENPTVMQYAEMELLSLLEKTNPDLRRSLLEIQQQNIEVVAVFADRIVGADFDSLSLSSLSKEIEANNRITLNNSDIARHYSAVFLPDLINAIFTVSKFGKGGNAYNVSSFPLTDFELKTTVYRALSPHGVTLKTNDDNTREATFSALSRGKLESLGFSCCCEKEDALSLLMRPYFSSFDLQQDEIRIRYDGKIDKMRELELKMLKEFDRICRKHDIPYFLSGGSLLGAVRHQGFIPWDDDIDVAMLRKDYHRFNRVVRDELDETFSYQSFRNRDGYHYFFDRITAKNTYFATKYSDDYEMRKGISVDVFVFDRAPKDAKAFWQHLMRKRLVMNVRWKNTARKGKLYLLSKLLLPILRLKSMDAYSLSYDKATRRYENKETGFVLPPATDHCFKGAMPESWFARVIPAKFEGVDTFIPEGYDGYLKAWYCDDYMTLLPIMLQTTNHDYYRLDLGSTITENEPAFSPFGELKKEELT